MTDKPPRFDIEALERLMGLDEPGWKEWFSIYRAWVDEKPIEKQDVLRALKSGAPVPKEVAPFLAAVIEGDYKFRRGNKKWYRDSVLNDPQLVMGSVLNFESFIRDPSLLADDAEPAFRRRIAALNARSRAKHRSDRITARQAAMVLAAEWHSISVRRVREKIRQFNKMCARLAEKSGRSENEVRDYFLRR